ncbi:hypothetical protein Sa4125_14560 [Aureimonas sp. SA4125]|nr:hypothetical protein Sa4125_14560 [Aureimonas sp. SA4125]
MTTLAGGQMATITGTSFGNVFNVTDTQSLALNYALGVHSVTVGARTFVYTAGYYDSGVSVFELGAAGQLTFVQTIGDTNSTALDGAANFASVSINGTSYLYVSGAEDSGISVFQVGSDGTLSLKQSVFDDATLEISGTEGRMSIATVGGNSYLVATGFDDYGISTFRINSNGSITPTDSVDDSSSSLNELYGAYSTATAVVGGNTFVFAAGYYDDGVTSFSLDANGQLTYADSVSDSATLQLSGAHGLATAVVQGTTYLFASGAHDDGISVFSVNSSGQLSNVFNIDDTGALGLDGASGLQTFQFGGQSFLAVVGQNDSAIGYFLISASGALTSVATLFDSAATELYGAANVTFAEVGGSSFLVATGLYDDGVSVFEIGGGNDTLTGTNSDDIMRGRGGADILDGLAGSDLMDGGTGGDLMRGGTGNDSYSVDNIGDDVIEFANEGSDVVYASVSFDLTANVESIVMQGTADIGTNGNALNNHIYGNSGNNYINGAGGSDLMSGGAGNDVYAVDSAGDQIIEAANGGTDTMYINLTYNMVPQVENLIMSGTGNLNTIGNGLSNTISGNSGNNVIDGGAGGDTIFGRAGGDALAGGQGADTISGNEGNDVIYGGTEGDLINGGANNDTISGNDGNDFIYGDDAGSANFGDTLNGNAGADSIFGFGGNDTIWGGADGDSLRGGDGGDTLRGEGGNDYLYGEGGADAFQYTARDFDTDQIFDFQNGVDKIQMSQSIFANYAAVMASSQQIGGDVLIDAGSGDRIALKNFSLANLTADDFIFY